MDTEKRIQRFSKIIIADLAAKSVQENNCFCEHLIYGKLLRISIKKALGPPLFSSGSSLFDIVIKPSEQLS